MRAGYGIQGAPFESPYEAFQFPRIFDGRPVAQENSVSPQLCVLSREREARRAREREGERGSEGESERTKETERRRAMEREGGNRDTGRKIVLGRMSPLRT
ncbi:hypothetical protein KM043_007492 [Ampulex compressa]|nr:hypothetical protein KM043_007492 [Ampulex compressa]